MIENIAESMAVRHIRDTLHEGRRAFAEGVPLEACPYKPGEAGHSLWDLAWQAARDEVSAAADPLEKKRCAFCNSNDCKGHGDVKGGFSR